MSRDEVWFAIPTANPAQCSETFAKWRAMGYRTAAAIDYGADAPENCDEVLVLQYQGWPDAVNKLCGMLDADIVVTGGDDMEPDFRRFPDDIAFEFRERFPDLFGVMQPCGDPWMDGAAARICGSPWLGRGWIERAYGGIGPLWPGYFHFFADESLKNVAEMLGVLWMRPDLTQEHHHWLKRGVDRPAYLHRAQAGWNTDQRLFNERRNAGFPGHQPKELHVQPA